MNFRQTVMSQKKSAVVIFLKLPRLFYLPGEKKGITKMKKLLSLMAAGLLVFSLAACGGETVNETENERDSGKYAALQYK